MFEAAVCRERPFGFDFVLWTGLSALFFFFPSPSCLGDLYQLNMSGAARTNQCVNLSNLYQNETWAVKFLQGFV